MRTQLKLVKHYMHRIVRPMALALSVLLAVLGSFGGISTAEAQTCRASTISTVNSATGGIQDDASNGVLVIDTESGFSCTAQTGSSISIDNFNGAFEIYIGTRNSPDATSDDIYFSTNYDDDFGFVITGPDIDGRQSLTPIDGQLYDLGSGNYTVQLVGLAFNPTFFSFTIQDVGGNQDDQIITAQDITLQSGVADLPPVVVNTVTPASADGLFAVRIFFSEGVTGFELNDLIVTNGTPTNLASTTPFNDIFTVDITPDGNGDVTLRVPADVVVDSANQGNLASETTVPLDTTRASVTITGVPTTTTGPFTATFSFNENISGFDLADVSAGLTNATASDFQTVTSGRVFTALITPTSPGLVTVSVLEGAAQDAVGNTNIASAQVTSDFTSPVGLTRQQIADFVGARLNLIMGNRSNQSRRLDRLNGSNGTQETVSLLGYYTLNNPARFHMAFEGTELSFAARSDRIGPAFQAFAAGDGFDVADKYHNNTRWSFWTEGRFSLFDDELSSNGRFSVIHAGVDYLATPDLLLGITAQLDWLTQNNTANAGWTEGLGWMAGPTLTARLDQSFYVDASVVAGQSYNEINPLGSYVDTFTTSRLLVSAGLIGDFEVGELHIQPGVEFLYMVEHQHAYTDSNAVRIGAQTLSQGEIRFGPRFERSFALAWGDALSAFLAFDGIYTFGAAGDYSTGSLARDQMGLTGSAEIGGTYRTSGGASLSLSGAYGGIGSDAQTYSGNVRLSIPFN